MYAIVIAIFLLIAAPVAAQTQMPASPKPTKPSPLATSTPGTYIDRWTLSTTLTFIGRIQIASSNTAAVVLEEATTVPNHTQRFALAQRVLNEPEFLSRRLAPMLAAAIPVTSTDHDNDPLTPPIIDTTWTDAQIQTLVDSRWNLLATAFVPPASATATVGTLPPGTVLK